MTLVADVQKNPCHEKKHRNIFAKRVTGEQPEKRLGKGGNDDVVHQFSEQKPYLKNVHVFARKERPSLVFQMR